jgi:hypothetical protein
MMALLSNMGKLTRKQLIIYTKILTKVYYNTIIMTICLILGLKFMVGLDVP